MRNWFVNCTSGQIR